MQSLLKYIIIILSNFLIILIGYKYLFNNNKNFFKEKFINLKITIFYKLFLIIDILIFFYLVKIKY